MAQVTINLTADRHINVVQEYTGTLPSGIESFETFTNSPWLNNDWADTYTGRVVTHFDVSKNTLTTSRSGVVSMGYREIDASGNRVWVSVVDYVVVQARGESEEETDTTPVFNLTPTALTVNSNNNISTINYEAKYISKVTVAVSDSSWLSASINTNTKVITVSIGENTALASRSGSLTVSYYDLTALTTPTGIITVPITQEADAGSITLSVTTDTQSSEINYVAQNIYFNIYTIGVDALTGNNEVTVNGEVVPWVVQGSDYDAGGTGTARWYRLNGWLEVPLNNTGEIRNITITFSAPSLINSSITISASASFIQSSKEVVKDFPLWRDTIVNFGNATDNPDYVNYNVKDRDGNIIYNGRVYPLPPDNEYTFNLSKVVNIDEKLDWDVPTIEGIFDNNGTKYVEVYRGDAKIGKYNIVNDWTYDNSLFDEGYYEVPQDLSHPVKNEVDSRQFFIASTYIPKDYDIDVEDPVLVSVSAKQGEQGIPANGIYFYPSNGISTIRLKTSIWSGNILCYLNPKRNVSNYKITCNHKYCLYYRNVWGGYDWVLLNKASVRKFEWERNTFISNILNYTARHSKKIYNTLRTEKYELKTDLLTNAESERMALALNSNEAYLQDLEKGYEVIPVNIITSSASALTRKSNSNNPIQYIFEVEAAKQYFIK